MKKYSLRSILIVAVLSLAFFVLLPVIADRILGIDENVGETKTNSVLVGDTQINVEIADTNEERKLGLSYRDSLDQDSGMLFLMPSRAVASFWMKDMNFPLDIIWIDGEEIVNISENLPPGGPRPDTSYSSVYPVDKVLEVNAGFVSERGIEVGDRVIFNFLSFRKER